MASGHVNRIKGRTHGCTDQSCKTLKKLLPTRSRRTLWRFSAAGMQVYRRAEAAGGRKAPRHEVAGGSAPAGQRALWGFDAGAELGDGSDAGRVRSADQQTETGNGTG